MADLYVIDTNIYVDALRNGEQMGELKRFLLRAGTRVRLNGIVAMELLAGAGSPAHIDAVSALITPYGLRGWTTSPSFEACAQAGRALAGLALGKRGRRRTIPPALVSDALIAASCREAGAVLVTKNAADFATLQRHMRGFRFLTPWPITTPRSRRG